MPISLAKSLKIADQRKAVLARREARATVRLTKRTLVVVIPTALFEAIQNEATEQDRFLVSIVEEALTQYLADGRPNSPFEERPTIIT